LGFDGRSKVLDFGIARIVGERRKTVVGMVRGTSSYMSPEQATDQSLDIRTDVFSLGVVFHELLTGERLFARGKALQDMMAVFQGAISLPSQANRKLPRSIDNLVLRMLERSLDKRFQTMGSFVEKLDKDFATIVWTEAECLQFMQKHFSKMRSDLEAMLSRIDVAIEPSTVIQRRPFEDAQTVIESRSSNRQKSFLIKEYDNDATALIDKHGNPLELPSKTDNADYAVSLADHVNFSEEEKTFCSQPPKATAPEDAVVPGEKAEAEGAVQKKAVFIVEFLEALKKEGSFSIRWVILGVLLMGLALGIGWWIGNKGYLQQAVEDRKTDEPKLTSQPQEHEKK
jgi:serine/threonine protein kinase